MHPHNIKLSSSPQLILQDEEKQTNPEEKQDSTNTSFPFSQVTPPLTKSSTAERNKDKFERMVPNLQEKLKPAEEDVSKSDSKNIYTDMPNWIQFPPVTVIPPSPRPQRVGIEPTKELQYVSVGEVPQPEEKKGQAGLLQPHSDDGYQPLTRSRSVNLKDCLTATAQIKPPSHKRLSQRRSVPLERKNPKQRQSTLRQDNPEPHHLYETVYVMPQSLKVPPPKVIPSLATLPHPLDEPICIDTTPLHDMLKVASPLQPKPRIPRPRSPEPSQVSTPRIPKPRTRKQPEPSLSLIQPIQAENTATSPVTSVELQELLQSMPTTDSDDECIYEYIDPPSVVYSVPPPVPPQRNRFACEFASSIQFSMPQTFMQPYLPLVQIYTANHFQLQQMPERIKIRRLVQF